MVTYEQHIIVFTYVWEANLEFPFTIAKPLPYMFIG